MLTAIGDTLAVAVERLKGVKAKSRVIILLSDGEQTAGVLQPDEAAKIAKTFGIKIYSIGVGTTGMAPFPGVDPFGPHLPPLGRSAARRADAPLGGPKRPAGGTSTPRTRKPCARSTPRSTAWRRARPPPGDIPSIVSSFNT